MKILSASLRNKLMLGCAFAAAAVLATPAAFARDRYYGHGDRAGEVIGALIVGAVVGGVIASAHSDRYYDGGYYAPQPYPSGYYGYSGYSYPSYPAYGYGGYYGNGGYYGSGVSVGLYYNGDRNRWRGHDRGYYRGYDRGYYRGSHGYYNGSRGWNGRSDDRGHRDNRHGGGYYGH